MFDVDRRASKGRQYSEAAEREERNRCPYNARFKLEAAKAIVSR